MADKKQFPWIHNVTNAHELTYLSEDKKKLIEEKAEAIDAMLDEHLEKDLANLSEEEKDAVYAEIKNTWDEYQELLRTTEYDTNWTVEEYRFIRRKIHNDVVYTQDNIFLGHKADQEIFLKYGEYGLTEEDGESKKGKNPKKASYKPYMVTIDQVTTIFTLISDQSVKGLKNKDSLYFASILSKFGSMSQVFNGYMQHAQGLSTKVQQIASKMDEMTEEQMEKLEKEQEEVDKQKAEEKKTEMKVAKAPKKKATKSKKKEQPVNE